MSQHIYTYDPANDQLNEIGGAGHVIKNESGTSFAKRENLQFNGLEVTDDATNNATIVTAIETNFVGTWAQWQALTLAERAQYKTVDLTDDFNGDPIDSVPTEGSPHAVSSGGVYSQIGDLDDLETTAKSNLVAAINEAAQSGGSGGGGSTVSVNTTDSELYGKTVTLTDGVTTLTKTISTFGVALFEGVTMIGEITVSCENVSVELEIPYYGKYAVTIEGGFNYDSWLAAGRVSETFESLDAVLEDEPTLRQLFLVHDAVDYLASQTVNTDIEKIFNTDLTAKWINNSDYALDTFYAVADIKTVMDEADKYGYGEWVLKPQVPTMTGNTAPYGEAIRSSVASTSYEAFKAFDGNASTTWLCSPSATDNYIGYKFVNPVNVKKVVIDFYVHASSPARTFTLQASNDNTTYVDLETFEVSTSNTNIELNISGGDYLYYRVFCAEVIHVSSQWSIGVNELQFYAWAPKGNVPVMTSNTAPYGTASQSTTYSSYNAYLAFDGNESTNSCTMGNVTSGYIQYQFTNPTCVRRMFARLSNNTKSNVTSISVYGSNDGSNFGNAIYTTSTIPSDNIYAIDNDDYYLYYRVSFQLSITTGIEIYTLQFYGRELKVSVPTMTSNTAPYGEAFAISSESGTYPWTAFNGNDANEWRSNDNMGTGGDYIGYEFPQNVKVLMAYVKGYSSAQATITETLRVESSLDGLTWSAVSPDFTLTLTTNSRPETIQTFTNNNPAKYYRVYLISASSASRFAMTRLQFYGLDYSEKEFEEGTTKKWLYDHGVVPLANMEVLSTSNGYTMGDYTFDAPTIEDSFIKCKSRSGNYTSGIAFTSIASDITEHSLILFKFDSIIPMSNIAGQLRTLISKTITNANTPAIKSPSVPQTDIPDYLDISNVNTAILISFATYSLMETNLYEIWLE